MGGYKCNLFSVQCMVKKLRGLPQILLGCFYKVLYIITLVNTHMSQHTTLVNLLQGEGAFGTLGP